MARTSFTNSRIPFPNIIQRGPSFVRNNINNPIDDFVAFFRANDNSSYCSGSFEFTPSMNYDPSGRGVPSIFNRPMEYYYSTMCDFCYALPHAAKWAVFIEPHNQEYLLQEMATVKNIEPTNSDQDWNFEGASRYLVREEAQNTIGCIFALAVQEPEVSMGVEQLGGSMNSFNNGFIRTPVTAGRSENSALDITVKETNCSYSDFFLRPWLTLISHKGLYSRPRSQSLKANIVIFELAPTFPRQLPIVRKIIKYVDCAPISISGENLNYEADRVIQRTIQFTYNYYTIQDGTGFGSDSNISESREVGGTTGADNNDIYGQDEIDVLDEK